VKNVTFYEDSYTLKRPGQHNNCIAVLRLEKDAFNQSNLIVIAPFFMTANSVCVKSEIHARDLHSHYLRISEERARQIHPNLFIRLENGANNGRSRNQYKESFAQQDAAA
jgi:hypothetical protein